MLYVMYMGNTGCKSLYRAVKEKAILYCEASTVPEMDPTGAFDSYTAFLNGMYMVTNLGSVARISVFSRDAFSFNSPMMLFISTISSATFLSPISSRSSAEVDNESLRSSGLSPRSILLWQHHWRA